ncbi:DUF3313 domain-containing protein [Metapseudomonas boanensis]|uniref:DUF3313 domain-containing protein n=1 Tax=Metapseudomonas boanensis TaxID=2822138 RepID=A0ABS5XLV5_9GAMM|nr:DUF3313 domain-containing protein [Pseudomonas boanensis]MBT8768035.1 DUF3313 domain-containing protein [Pseudomonas boanensis]
MRANKWLMGGTLAAALILNGCTSHTTSQEQYSGFLSSYDDLKEVKTSSGTTVLRWTAPNFNPSNYSGLIYQPINFYPPPKPTEQISNETLTSLLQYTNEQISQALASRLPLTTTRGPGTLIFKGAITGVSTATEGLKPYEVIPIALVVAGAMTATGHRDQNTELYLEGEFIDASTGMSMARVVRKGFGKTLDNDEQQVTLDDLKAIVNDMAKDIRLYP